eukprot:CAMPEP_0168530412 /NCGR_PEP_ID=MMETSP0405-20121227/14643_1 /TAXON_ID=498012 /ORGANISM="Trichosphaerium sp, Strain Am-I-7 wt" /LENGTH=166 /DNA_ID=CAMNT_0008554631 /DNA_START=10 /DNA_END=510 /DNA_ORIENTATION=-
MAGIPKVPHSFWSRPGLFSGRFMAGAFLFVGIPIGMLVGSVRKFSLASSAAATKQLQMEDVRKYIEEQQAHINRLEETVNHLTKFVPDFPPQRGPVPHDRDHMAPSEFVSSEANWQYLNSYLGFDKKVQGYLKARRLPDASEIKVFVPVTAHDNAELMDYYPHGGH